jgi:hypothetical protein
VLRLATGKEQKAREKRKAKRALTRIPTEQVVAKKMRDNFPRFSDAEKKSNIVDGKSLEEHLTEDVHDWHEGGDIKWNAGYFGPLLDKYRDSSSAVALLKINDPSEKQDPHLMKALNDLKEQKPSHTGLLTHFKTGGPRTRARWWSSRGPYSR